MYKIVITKRAIRNLERLDKKTRDFIGKKIKEYTQENPLRNARKLVDPKIGSYRFRIGDYRVIFDIEDNIIVILRIGHRKEISHLSKISLLHRRYASKTQLTDKF